MELRRVVVTGLGAITPVGNSAKDFFDNLLSGISGAGPITAFDSSKFKTKFACEVKNFNPEDHFDRKEARKLDRYAHFALVAADDAIKDSAIDCKAVNTDRVGVIMGVGIGGLNTFYSEVADFARGDGTPRFNPFFIPKMIADIAAGHISIKYGFRGPNYTTVSACASSTHAIIDAFNAIRLGKADIIIAGGAEAAVTQAGLGGFNAMKALSERNDDPQTASRPFDKDRDGFVLGEGAGMLVLEEKEHAIRRNARIYAELSGGGMSADAHHITAPHPDGLGAVLSMKVAMEDAVMNPSDIAYINVHGTSTPLGDVSELKAIQQYFGEHAFRMNISSTKSMTGHLLGAAGAIEAIASIFAVYKDVIPPTINHFTDDPEIDPRFNLTFNKKQNRTVEAALSNTFGFGGHNATVIFKKFSTT
ncbi:MAG: beta-ketoacyl-ACP synthase II [Bacteroidetes bacterium]|nr:beta-ketoacyl-ACP synthase II [Bacteroidota bacterium]